MGYISSNTPPQGEVWIRGPSVTKGYYLNPEKTFVLQFFETRIFLICNFSEEVFTPDGWFKTGDVGTWNPDGTLSIVDRVKNLVKNPFGEYIALEKLESVYKNSNYVLNTCVYADGETPTVIAIVQPQPNATDNRKGKGDFTKDKDFAKEVQKDLNAVGVKNGVSYFF